MSRRRNQNRSVSSVKKGFSFFNLLPWVIGGIVCFIVATFIFLTPAPLDPKTFCPKDNKNIGKTAVIIDISDKLSLSQKAQLENELLNLSSSGNLRSPYLEKGNRLIVYILDEEGLTPEKIFDLCNPGKLSDRSVTETLSQGEIYAQKRWKKFSTDILERVDAKIEASKDKSTSPILEGIKYIRSKEFPPTNLLDANLSYRILIWSDMLQNSSIENHFQNISDVREIYKLNPIQLNEIELIVFHLMSKKYSQFQNNAQVAWWRRFFALARANLDWKVM